MNKFISVLISLSVLILISCSYTKKTHKDSVAYSYDKSTVDMIVLDDLLINKNGYMKIPIRKLLTGHLVFNVVLNGVDGRFILDTGAGGTVVELKRKDK